MQQTKFDLENYLNQLLNPSLFEDYAPNGLQVDGKLHVNRIAFAVSATQESIKKATQWGADALIVHHGIFWKHQGSRTITGAWGERVKLCVKFDLNLLAYHLPLDAHPELGNASALASQIGLTNLSSFALYKRSPLGVKGTFSKPISAKELKQNLKLILNHDVILASPDETKLISSLGIVTGGANNEWIKALDEGVEAYLTGEISEYNWHDAIEAGIHYFAGGHHATEKFGIQSLMHQVKNDHPQFEVIFFDSANPA
jgi:dinuclear metal center YbgI/SA1388 family protein